MRNRNEYITAIISKIILVGISFINSVLINRYLGPVLKGEYTYILNIANIITIIIGFNIASSYPYFYKKYGIKIRQKIINIIFIQMLIYIAISVILTYYLHDYMYVYIIIISLLLQFSNQLDFISIMDNINKRNNIVVISNIIYLLMLFYLYFYTKNNLKYIVVTLILFNIIKSILYILKSRIIPSTVWEASPKVIEIIRFSFFPMITTLLTTFNYNVDIVILKKFVDNFEIGIYSVAVTLASMLWIIPDAFKEVLFNKTAKSDSIEMIITSIKINIYICIVFIGSFIMLGKNFILFVYGIEYIDTYNVSVILLIGTIPMIFFKIINTLYISIGKQKYSFYILLISVILNVVMNLFMIPIWGIEGAAISSVSSYFICGIVMIISFIRRYKINIKNIFLINNDEKNKIKNIILKYKC